MAKQVGSSDVITKAPGGSRILGVADGATGFSQQLTATAPAPPPAPVPPPPVESPPGEPAPIVSVPAVLGHLCNAVGFGLFSDSLCKDPVAEKEPNQKEAASKSQEKAPSNEPKPKPEEQKPPSAPEQKQKKKKKNDSHKEPALEGKISVVKPRFGKAPPTLRPL